MIVCVVLRDHECCIHGHECSTWVQDQLYELDTTIVRTANEKRVIASTTSGTDQDFHRRIMKTHSRSEYNSTSEELVDKTLRTR